MSDEQTVLTERRGRVLLITLNRPDARNAVDGSLAHGIAAALDELDGDGELQVGVLTGDPITAERGYELGLVNRVADPGGAVDAALELAGAIAPNAPLALAASKRIVLEAPSWDPSEAWNKQREISGPVFASEDAREGATAFAEKREPVWKGR